MKTHDKHFIAKFVFNYKKKNQILYKLLKKFYCKLLRKFFFVIKRGLLKLKDCMKNAENKE